MNAAQSFAAAIDQQITIAQSDPSPAFLAENTVPYAAAKISYFNALRAAMPELTNIETGRAARTHEVEQVSRGVPGRWEIREIAADKETAALLKRFSGHPEIQKAAAEFDNAQKLTTPLGKDRTGLRLLMAQAVDVTNRKEAEAATQRANEQLREQAAVLEVAPVLVRDLEDRIVVWTQGAERLYGFSKAQALGRVSYELLETEFAEGRAHVNESLRCNGHWEGELVHRKRDGMRLVVASQQIVYCDSTGRPVRILQVNADITERKAAEARLRETDQQFRQLAENISEVFWMSDPSKNQLLFVSPAYETLWGHRGVLKNSERTQTQSPLNCHLHRQTQFCRLGEA